ncbi:hypothetical protein BLA29_009550 [Euroglyphus maynei]|uniref:Uncharacterized protein n=1 Tax=Euroglyphus maynei TaxID=6958 RepID=A0A1Y3BJ41_EURMA|nr:hypothetical protein BLA29_009550 [Euroglyphus maynei]
MTNIIIDHRCSLTLILTLIISVTIFQSFSIDESEFDVNEDLNIDPPKVAGMDGMIPENVVKSTMDQSPSTAPQPQNEVRDISGWGLIGKIHPKVLINDHLIRAYHNRPLDPRYLHLQNYGHLHNSGHSSADYPSDDRMNKLFNF